MEREKSLTLDEVDQLMSSMRKHRAHHVKMGDVEVNIAPSAMIPDQVLKKLADTSETPPEDDDLLFDQGL